MSDEEQQQTSGDEEAINEEIILYSNKETTEVRYHFNAKTGKFTLLTMPWFMKKAPEETKTATIEWIRECAICDLKGKKHPKIPEITLEWRMRPEIRREISAKKHGHGQIGLEAYL